MTMLPSLNLSTLHQPAAQLVEFLGSQQAQSLLNAPIIDTVKFSGNDPLKGIKYDELQEFRGLLAKPFEEVLNIAATMLSQDFADKRQAVVNDAKAHIEVLLSQNPKGNPAIAMDIDETIVNNVAEFLKKMLPSQDGGGLVHMKWMKEGNAPAIAETLEFFNWLKEVEWVDSTGEERKGIPVFFVTARKDEVKLFGSDEVMDLRASTIKNLERLGIEKDDYPELYMKPHDDEAMKKSGDFKEWAYNDIESKDYDLIMVMGDQDSDFQGFNGYRAQLPNPMY